MNSKILMNTTSYKAHRKTVTADKAANIINGTMSIEQVRKLVIEMVG